MLIDKLYQDAATALEAIAKFRAAERAQNDKLARLNLSLLVPEQPSDAVAWSFYKAASQVFDEPEITETFENICDDMGVDSDGNALDAEGASRMSDEEFDYRHAKMGRAYL